jgi:hypothetical protein
MKGHTDPTIRSTDEGEIVGPKMHSAVETVAQNGAYASKNQLAKTVGPNGSQDYGYRIVDRCISKGLLGLDDGHDDATPQGRGAVVITAKGERYLEQERDL